jgi:hypothetical protein
MNVKPRLAPQAFVGLCDRTVPHRIHGMQAAPPRRDSASSGRPGIEGGLEADNTPVVEVGEQVIRTESV